MELKGNKKILLLGMVLLIVAGIIVVALKGFKVSLILQKHESNKLCIATISRQKKISESYVVLQEGK